MMAVGGESTAPIIGGFIGFMAAGDGTNAEENATGEPRRKGLPSRPRYGAPKNGDNGTETTWVGRCAYICVEMVGG